MLKELDRIEKDTGKLWINKGVKIKCLKCNDIIESKHVHDSKKCKCGACFIDGGDKYTRVGGDLKYIHWVYDDGHEEEIK